MTFQRIVDSIPVRAVNCPNKVAVICGSEQVTYSQLNTMLEKRSEELANSLGKYRRHVIIKNSQDIDYVVTYLSAHLINCTAVPVEESISKEKITDIENLLGRCEWERDIADILFTTGTTGDSKGVMISHKAIVADAENLIDAQGFCEDTVFVISGPLNHIGSLSKIWATFYAGGCIYITNGLLF